MSPIDEIVEISHRYGAGTDWVIGGGGNTSIKDDGTLYVKASGTLLGTITKGQFVAMDRRALEAIWAIEYPDDPDERERRALADLLAARVEGEAAMRPSVETLMHAMLPQRVVVHTHPTLLNGISCSREGEDAARRLFGDRFVWIPVIDPGYTLAADIRRRIAAWRAGHGDRWPAILVMQNHGIVVAGESGAEIESIHAELVEATREAVTREPRMEPMETDGEALAAIGRAVAAAVAAAGGGGGEAPVAEAFSCPELLARAESEDAFAPVASAFSPDHIVYSGHRPLHVASAEAAALPAAVRDYVAREKTTPRIVVVPGIGAVALGATARKAQLARLLFLDTLRIACYAESFGGALHMPEQRITFIRNWEVEAFRERQSTGG